MSGLDKTHLWYSMSFSQRLQALRKERGVTQKTLGEMVGVHTTQIQRYESGETQPSLTALRKLAIALNVSADALVFDSDEREAVIDGLILRHTANRFSKAS